MVVLPSMAKLPLLTTEDSATRPPLVLQAERVPDSKPSLKTGRGFAVGVLVTVGVKVGVFDGVAVAVGVNVMVGVGDGMGVACTFKTN